MRVCPRCPNCNRATHGEPCQDLFGSNAAAEGGSFARMDAAATSIEAQKSTGSLHARSQCFVQCLHQHTPLWEVLAIIRSHNAEFVPRFLRYKAHVSRQTYADTNGLEQRLLDMGHAWPEYKDTASLFLFPQYMSCDDMFGASPAASIPKVGSECGIATHTVDDTSGLATDVGVCDSATSTEVSGRQSQTASVACSTTNARIKMLEVVEEGRLWQKQHQRHVQCVQEHKLHHIHILNASTGERMPLTHCRRADNPKLCKADVPGPSG